MTTLDAIIGALQVVFLLAAFGAAINIAAAGIGRGRVK